MHQAYISMVQIKNEIQYKAACERINELLKVVNNDTPADDKNLLELDLISDLVADYEEEHWSGNCAWSLELEWIQNNGV